MRDMQICAVIISRPAFFLFATMSCLVLASWPVNATTVHPNPSLKEFVEEAELIVIARTVDLRFFKTSGVVETVIKGDQRVKRIVLYSKRGLPYEVGQTVLLFVPGRDLRHDKNPAREEVSIDYPGSERTVPITKGVVGPIQMSGEAERQEIGDFLRKIDSYLRKEK